MAEAAAAAAAAEAAIQLQITRAVAAAMAAHIAGPGAAAVPVTHVAVKLPDFWVQDPHMWFSQAEAQFRRARISVSTTMYDHVLMKLPETVIMAIRSLIQTIEADPTLADTSYQRLKTALLCSFGKTKWQMAYALLDHPDLGDRRPSVMMAEMLSLRYETTAPDSLFLALFLRCLPDSIREHLAAADHKTAAEMAAHADILWDARKSTSVSSLSDSVAAVSLRGRSPTPRRSPNRRQDNRRQYRSPTPVTRRRPDSRSRNEDPNLCYYHDKFKHKALKCESPCTWSKN
jgi:hypothetical protein